MIEPIQPPAACNACLLRSITVGHSARVAYREGWPRLGNAALYNAARPQDDAIIEIYYGAASASSAGPVRAVHYSGDRDHAPPGLPFVVGLPGEQLRDRFANVEWSAVPNNDSKLEMFAGGLTAFLWHLEVKKSGIVIPLLLTQSRKCR